MKRVVVCDAAGIGHGLRRVLVFMSEERWRRLEAFDRLEGLSGSSGTWL